MVHKLPHYIVLFGLFGVTILGFILFSWDKTFQIALIVALATSYLAWGIVHHWLHDDLYPEIVLEYALIAILGSIFGIMLLI